jgi:peptide/nickel transport system substrate-binding protein
MRSLRILQGFVIVLSALIFTVVFLPQQAWSANELRIGLGVDADSLNPHDQTTTIIQNILDFVYDPLFYENEKGELEPRLATKMDVSKDGLVYTLTLRKGVKFHDGTPFNAEALKVTFDRALDPATKLPQRSTTYAFVSKFEIVNEYEVKIHLKEPFAPFNRVLTGTILAPMSPKAIKEAPDKLAVQPIGTGPFKFQEWVKGDRIVFVRNDDYYGKKPSLDKVIFKIVPEAGTRTAMIRAGDLDLIYAPPPPDVPTLEKDPNLKVVKAPSTRVMFIAINNSKDLFKDKRVRQAFNYAVNKDLIVNKVLMDLAQVSEGPTAPSHFGYYKTGKYEYNPKKAKELLAAAKFPMDTKIQMMTPTGRYMFDKQVSEAIQAYLNEIGLQVELRTYDWPTYIAMITKPVDQNETQLFFLGWGTTVQDAHFMMFPQFHSSQWPPIALCETFYKNPEVDKAIEAARDNPDPKKRIEAYKNASKMIWDDAPMIFLYVQKYVVVHRSNIEGIVVNAVEKFNAIYAKVK